MADKSADQPIIEGLRRRLLPRDAGAQWRAVASEQRDSVLVFDRRGVIVQVLALDGRLFPDRSDALCGLSLEALLPAERVAAARRAIAAVLADGRAQALLRRIPVDGIERWFSARILPLIGADDRVLCTLHDVTEMQRALEDQRRSEIWLETVIDHLPFDVFVIDADGRYALINRAARERWGALLGQRPEDQDVDAQTKRIWLDNNRRAFAGETVTGEVRFAIGDQEHHFYNIIAPIRIDDRVQAILGANIDISDRIELERQRQQTQKLESVGVLAGGIAHDFNNLLTAVLGSVSMARLSRRDGESVEAYLVEAERACQRASGLTEQLLTFSRGGQPMRQAVDLATVLEEAGGLALRGSNCRLELELTAPLPPAWVDRGQLFQVIHNLVLNAAQAMPQGGLVRIAADAQNPPAAERQPDAPAQLRIRVSDQGRGMAPDVQRRIFEPYYTTKTAGHGLGLAVVHSILQRHDGDIAVDSQPGRGSTFTLRLPAARRLPAEPRGDTAEHPAAAGGRILVLDDEKILLDLLGTMLERAGYEPLLAAGCDEALRLLEREPAPLAAVIDLTLPGEASGVDCLKRLRRRRPGLPALVASGYANDPVLARPAEHGFQGRLAKPFHYEQLIEALRAIL
jgi:PAS domain S-box-containing protein